MLTKVDNKYKVFNINIPALKGYFSSQLIILVIMKTLTILIIFFYNVIHYFISKHFNNSKCFPFFLNYYYLNKNREKVESSDFIWRKVLMIFHKWFFLILILCNVKKLEWSQCISVKNICMKEYYVMQFDAKLHFRFAPKCSRQPAVKWIIKTFARL